MKPFAETLGQPSTLTPLPFSPFHIRGYWAGVCRIGVAGTFLDRRGEACLWGNGFKLEMVLFLFLRKSGPLLEKWVGVSGCELMAGNDPL